MWHYFVLYTQRDPAGLAGDALAASGIRTPSYTLTRQLEKGRVASRQKRKRTRVRYQMYRHTVTPASRFSHVHTICPGHIFASRRLCTITTILSRASWPPSPTRVPPMPQTAHSRILERDVVPPKVSSKVVVLLLVQAPHHARLAALLAQLEHAEPLAHAAPLRQSRSAVGALVVLSGSL